MKNKRGKFLADLASKLPRSPIRAMFDEAEKLKESGKELIELEIGEPDFDTPQNIIDAAKRALDHGETHYTPNAGTPELREVISEKLERENDIHVSPESQIVVTAGAMEAIYLSLLMTVGKGGEVLIPDPGWPNFGNQVLMAGGKPVRYHLTPENNFRVQLEELKDLINRKTKGILINTPSNPLGTVLDRSTLSGIADVATDKNLLIYSDEAYEKLIYGNNKHVSIGSFDEVREQVLTICSLSKSYAMTGWRVGYVAGNEGIVKGIIKARESTSSCTCSISQAAAVEALKHGGNSVEHMRRSYEERKDVLMDCINRMPTVWCIEPQGAFYAFLNISKLSEPSLKIAKRLLHEKRVVTVPGSGFGEMGEGFLRLSFATDKKTIVEGLKRIHTFVEELVG